MVQLLKMPFTAEKLPDRIKKLPPKQKSQWMKVFNSMFSKTKDEKKAFAAANVILSKKEGKDKSKAEQMKEILSEIKNIIEAEEEVEVMENQDINIMESFSIIEEGSDNKSATIEFVAAQAGLSGNDRRYKTDELTKQQLKGLKMFTDHNHNVENVVGIVREGWMDGRKLKAKATIMNSHKHPDVVEMVRDGRIDSVSIGGKGTIKRVKEGDKYVKEVHDLIIKELSLVGIGGIANAKINSIGG